jgi:hypothetical protein
MDPLEHLRERISGFPGYAVDIDRRRSDELVRSYLGEALAEMAARCPELSSELRGGVDALLLRVGFATPKSFSPHNGHLGLRTSDGSVADVDAATIDVADRAATISCDAIAAYLDDVTAALDARDAAMRAAAAQTQSS